MQNKRKSFKPATIRHIFRYKSLNYYFLIDQKLIILVYIQTEKR